MTAKELHKHFAGLVAKGKGDTEVLVERVTFKPGEADEILSIERAELRRTEVLGERPRLRQRPYLVLVSINRG